MAQRTFRSGKDIAGRIATLTRKLTAAGLGVIVLPLLLSISAWAQQLGIPSDAPGESRPSRDVRPDPPPPQPEPAITVEAELEIPPSLAAPLDPDMREPAVIGPPGTLPDEVVADELTYEPDGTIVLKGVRLSVASLVSSGGPAIVTAGYGRISAQTQSIELSSGVTVEVQNVPRGIPLQLAAQAASWDPVVRRLSVQGLVLPVPLRELLGDDFPASEIEPRFAGHVRVQTPSYIYINAEQVTVEQQGKEQSIVLNGVEVSPSPRPRADLYVTAREARITAEDQIVVSNAAVWVEGLKVLTWPRFSRGTEGRSGILSFDAPSVSVDLEGIEARQEITVNLDPFRAETTLAYAEQYDLIAHGYAYANVWSGGQLGVQHGDIVASDFRRNSYVRSDDVVLTARQLSRWGPWRLTVDLESGDVGARHVTDAGLGDLTLTERTAVVADLELAHSRIAGDWYFTSGASAARFDYGLDEYEATGARAGLIFRQDGFNNFVLYREHDISGLPVLPFDEVRRRELDFQARASLVPRLSHIVRGVYDFDLDDYDRLELGTLLERRGYELGFYWDFARDRAGLELGLLTP